MPIADNWDFNYAAKVLSHIDGVLSYDTGGGRQAAVGEYIKGNTSGAIGKIIAVTGNTTSGTLTLTEVTGLFEDNETFEVLSELGFDAVTDGNGGFQIGDRIDGNSSGSQITVDRIEYNSDGLGGGTIYGNTFTAAFTDNEQLDIGAPTARIQLDVADADGVGVDNDAALTTTQTAGTLAVPGTASTNDSVIIHYDAGSVAIPEQAIIRDNTSGAFGLVEQVYGDTTTGSVRIVDSDTTGGAWTNDNPLHADQVIAYNNQVAGQVFTEGDVVVGATSGATGRVLLDTGTELILADESGTWTTTEDLEVGGTKIAEANGTNTTLSLATLNLPDGVRSEQRPTSVAGGVAQGGIYDSGDSLNIVRKMNSWYTLSQDTFDELLQLDDDEALDAQAKAIAYQIVFDWTVPDLSMRNLRSGGLTDTSGANVWANAQTVGVLNKIGNNGFLYDSSTPTPQPQLYVEQQGSKLDSWWLEGQIDVLVKVRTRTDPALIAAATPTLGQLIPGGDPAADGSFAVFAREYHISTYDTTQVNAPSGGVQTVALGTADDTTNNPQGTHTMNWNTGSAATLVVGEEFTTSALTGNDQKVGIVVAQTGDAGATGTLEYVLKSGSQFLTTEALIGSVSGKTFAVNGAPTDVVAGFSADIRYNVVDIAATPSGGTGITGTFIPGEGVTQAVTGATGFVVLADTTNDILYIETSGSTAFSGDNDITGDVSTATWDAGTGATYPSDTDFSADLNNGEGLQPYSGSVGANIANTGAETISNVYQYGKYITRAEETSVTIGGPGTSDGGTVGQLYRRLQDAFTEVKPGEPLGTFAGVSMFFAQGWFLDTDFLNAADIRSFRVTDNNGINRNPPNLQSLSITGTISGDRVAAYRSTGAGQTTILRNEFEVGTVGGGNNQAANSTILVAANTRTVSPLPADVPDSGVLRILDPNDTGNYLRFPYSSVNRTTNVFTLASGTIGAVTGSVDLTLADNVHVVFLEEQAAGSSTSNTVQYVADIPLVYKARVKGIKPFRSTGTFTSTGANLGVVRNPDGVVDLP